MFMHYIQKSERISERKSSRERTKKYSSLLRFRIVLRSTTCEMRRKTEYFHYSSDLLVEIA